MAHVESIGAGSLPMSDETRGQSIKSRRLALGFESVREFAEASGIDRGALGKAEKGTASSATVERAEAWLDRFEEKTGHDEPTGESLRFTLHDVYGVGEIIVEGPSNRPDELVEAVSKLLAEIQRSGE